MLEHFWHLKASASELIILSTLNALDKFWKIFSLHKTRLWWEIAIVFIEKKMTFRQICYLLTICFMYALFFVQINHPNKRCLKWGLHCQIYSAFSVAPILLTIHVIIFKISLNFIVFLTSLEFLLLTWFCWTSEYLLVYYIL